MGSPSGAAPPRRYGYVVLSAAVGTVLVLALARANYLVGGTVGNACGSFRDAVTWSLTARACRLSDGDRFDLVNGGIVVLVVIAALNPTLVALRIALLVPVLLYLNDAGRIHATFVATGRVYPGIELWHLPISWLSALVLVTSLAIASARRVKRCFGSRGGPGRGRGQPQRARAITGAWRTSPRARGNVRPAARPPP